MWSTYVHQQRKENKNHRNNGTQTQPRSNISYKITDGQLWVESKPYRKTWKLQQFFSICQKSHSTAWWQSLTSVWFLPSNLDTICILALEAPFCPEPLVPYLLPPHVYYLKASRALDYPLLNFVVCDMLKSNTEMNQEILKQHKRELRKENFQTLHKSKAALNIFICQKKSNNKKIYLDFNVSYFSSWSYNGSPNQSRKNVLWKIRACIATFHKLKRKK